MKQPQKLAIFVNGNLSEDSLKFAGNYDFLIATDIASLRLIKNGVIPDIAIGDFDSITATELDLLKDKVPKLSIFPAEKNYTDLELAINYTQKLKPANIDIFGATGSRMDHTLGAIFLLEKKALEGIKTRIIDSNNELSLVDDNITIHESDNFPYLSVLPITNYADISIIGVRYELDKKRIFKGQTIGISNEINQKKCEIIVHKGKVLITRSRD